MGLGSFGIAKQFDLQVNGDDADDCNKISGDIEKTGNAVNLQLNEEGQGCRPSQPCLP